MKTMKIFLSIAALALVGAMMTGCSNDDEELQPVKPSKLVTLTTTVGFDGAETRALTATGVKTFAENDQMVVIYKNTSGDTKKAVGTLTAGAGSASGTFTVTLDAPDNNAAIRYIYPAAMAKATIDTDATIDDAGTVDFTNLYSQEGTLADLGSKYDLCTYDAANWSSGTLPTGTLENQLAILAITLKDNAETPAEITSSITRLVLSDGSNTYTVGRSAAAGPIYVAIRPTNSATINLKATDGYYNFTKSLASKTYEVNNGYNVSWKMVATELPTTYIAPKGYDIQDPGVDNWLRKYGFTQADINALGYDDAAENYFYECWLYNCDFTVAAAGCVSVSVTDTTRIGDYVTSVTVKLVRTAPLGYINGFFYLYANGNRIADEFVDADLTFNITPTIGTETQIVTAPITTYIKAKTITAAVEVYQPSQPEP